MKGGVVALAGVFDKGEGEKGEYAFPEAPSPATVETRGLFSLDCTAVCCPSSFSFVMAEAVGAFFASCGLSFPDNLVLSFLRFAHHSSHSSGCSGDRDREGERREVNMFRFVFAAAVMSISTPSAS